LQLILKWSDAMKIWGDFSRITGIYGKDRSVKRTHETGKAQQGKDVVSISNKARDVQVVQKALAQEPDVRKEKVDELTAKYRSGSYSPSGEEIAEKIIQSVFDKKA
jgi:negative regulator of flagellin synthesis FlgM